MRELIQKIKRSVGRLRVKSIKALGVEIEVRPKKGNSVHSSPGLSGTNHTVLDEDRLDEAGKLFSATHGHKDSSMAMNVPEYGVAEDRSWAVNLGYGYAFFVHCSGNEYLAPEKYIQVAQLVAEPSQELGLQVSMPEQSAYSTGKALQLGDNIADQLRLRDTCLASVFDFIWRVMLLLLAVDVQQSRPNQERERLETVLTSSARNAHLLDEYSRQLIHDLAWKDLRSDRRKEEEHRFAEWAHEKTGSWKKGPA